MDGRCRGPMEVSFKSFLGVTEEYLRETSVRMVVLPAEIQTGNILNKNYCSRMRIFETTRIECLYDSYHLRMARRGRNI
jgi:hypothetical protein